MYAFTLTHFLFLRAYVLYGCSQKELNSKNLKKIIHFPILKETEPTIFCAIDVITSLSVAFFRVTLRDRAQTFV